jgi:hypothetical protein
MMKPMSPTSLITLSERAYRAMLIFYPADYRREYGSLMVQVFRDVCRDTYHRQGLAGILFWWCATLLDLTLTVIEQRRKVRLAMSKSTWIQMTGILLVVGGFFGAVASFSELQPGDHYTYYGIYQVFIWLLAPGFLLTGLGCFGLALRYDQALGTPGRWTLYLSGFGMLVMTVGVIATSIEDSLWDIWMVGGLLHTAGLTAFGLLHLMKPTLPVFRGLPLQIAAGWLVMWLGVLRTSSQTTNNTLTFLIFVGMGLAWLAIGLAVHRQKRDDTVLAAA